MKMEPARSLVDFSEDGTVVVLETLWDSPKMISAEQQTFHRYVVGKVKER